MRDLVLLGAAGLALFFGSRLFGAKKVADKSIVRVLNPRIVKADGNGLLVRFDVAVDNPTNTSMRISKPVITLSSRGKYMASSVPQNKQYSIGPLSQTSLDFAEITLPWMTLSSYAAELISNIPTLIKSFQTQGRLSFQMLSIPLEYKYSTYVNDLFYESPLNPIL
jgi:hypothetical protein